MVKLIPRYPVGLTDDEKYHVESMARNVMNMTILQREVPDPRAWPRYFWRHNYDLVPCQPRERRLVGSAPVSAADGEKLVNLLGQNARAVREYLDLLRNRLRPDLYDPRHDEVLFGLFARLTRLYVVMADPFLWARDMGGIMLAHWPTLRSPLRTSRRSVRRRISRSSSNTARANGNCSCFICRTTTRMRNLSKACLRTKSLMSLMSGQRS